jgi:hypothetical protein
MFTARILIATTFLTSLVTTACATQVRLNPHKVSAVSPQKAFTYGLHCLQGAALSKNQDQIEQAIEKMISCWTSAALNYNPEAAYALGDLYEMGTLSELRSLPGFANIIEDPACCKRNLDKALAMYTLAAGYGRSQTFQYLQCESKSIYAMAIKGLISLGVRFQHGVGTEQDFKKAAACFATALENGGSVPTFLYQKSTSTKNPDSTENSQRTYAATYNDLTVDTTLKIQPTPKANPNPPTTKATPQDSNPNPARTIVSFGCCGTILHVTPEETSSKPSSTTQSS